MLSQVKSPVAQFEYTASLDFFKREKKKKAAHLFFPWVQILQVIPILSDNEAGIV